MKILIVSYYFAPFNAIASLRLTKLAEYWHDQGHDVFVLTAKNLPLPSNLTTSLPFERVIDTNWLNINALPEKVMGGRATVSTKGFDTKSGFLKSLGRFYKDVLNIPDGQIGWFLNANRAGSKLIASGWRPDLIYASSPPATSFLVASKLSRKFSIPWVAEYRDLWTTNHSYNPPFWRKFIDLGLERRVLDGAAAAITVSPPLADSLSDQTYGMPIGVVMNGFDPKDYLDTGPNVFALDKLNIVYTGMVYPGKQDLSILFLALSEFDQKDWLRVHFYGRYSRYVSDLVKKYHLEDVITVSDSVSHKDSVSIQKASDVLLFFTWNDENNKGVLTGKIFEYFGARKPILAIGSQVDQAANMIMDRNAGIVTGDVLNIQEQLRKWLDQKFEEKKSFDLPASVSMGLTRDEQFVKLDNFLIKNGLMKE